MQTHAQIHPDTTQKFICPGKELGIAGPRSAFGTPMEYGGRRIWAFSDCTYMGLIRESSSSTWWLIPKKMLIRVLSTVCLVIKYVKMRKRVKKLIKTLCNVVQNGSMPWITWLVTCKRQFWLLFTIACFVINWLQSLNQI